MSAADIATIIGALTAIAVPIGAGFAFLINTIVKQSKETVHELRGSIEVLEKDRDRWMARALKCEAKAATR